MTALLETLRRHRVIVLGVPALLVALTLAVGLLRGSRYTANSSFILEDAQEDAMSRYAGIAAQFGLSLPGSGDGQSPEFYARLLESPSLLTDLAVSEFSFTVAEEGHSVEGTLLDIYDLHGTSEGESRKAAITRLQDDISVTPDPSAGFITVRVTAPWPELAVQINRRALELLDQFNRERRQLRATTEREFIERTMSDALAALNSAEDGLQAFLERNRTYQSSPQLTFESARLQRRVDLRQQVYTSLAGAYEQARIEEIRTTPVITIVDEPGSLVEQEQNLVMLLVFALVVGVVLGIGIALAREFIAEERARAAAV